VTSQQRHHIYLVMRHPIYLVYYGCLKDVNKIGLLFLNARLLCRVRHT